MIKDSATPSWSAPFAVAGEYRSMERASARYVGSNPTAAAPRVEMRVLFLPLSSDPVACEDIEVVEKQ
jgi:hypothetical protein